MLSISSAATTLVIPRLPVASPVILIAPHGVPEGAKVTELA